MTVTLEPEGRKVRADVGSTLLRVMLESGVSIRTECGGKGVCGKCRIIVKDQSRVSERTKFERLRLREAEIRDGYRLACQCYPRDNMVVYVPEESRVRERKIQVEGVERPVKLDPMISKVHVTLKPPTLAEVKPDLERLLESLEVRNDVDVDEDALRSLPDVLRAVDWDVTVTLWDMRRVISVELGDMSDLSYGAAIDIGTSKIVAYLVNLSKGEVVGVSSVENPQIIHGEDVISRITYTMEISERLEELRALALKGVNSVLSEACESAGIESCNVYEVTVVGNTAMHHLFLGIQPKFLALSPYVPVLRRPLNLKAKTLGISINPGGVVHTLPVVAGFVGSDDIGDILSTGIHKSKEMSLLIDIGTNTEVNLGNQDDILCCSCASGPAFEGAHITHGMKAVRGAIERVRIDPKTYDVKYETIGGVKPIGLCGSAMVDILAGLLECQLVNRSGRLRDDVPTPRLRKWDGTLVFAIAAGEETETGKDIVITQRDIRELQLAKAAIFTGCSILMKRKGVLPKDVGRVYVAGAFGNYIDPAKAKTVGLTPDIPTERVTLVGNAAISGAKMALVSKEVRDEAERLSRWVRYLELGADPDFVSEFTSAMFFPHKDLDRFPSLRSTLKV